MSFNIELASNAPLSVDSQSSQFDVESAFYTLTGAHYQDQVWSILPAFELLPIDWSRQKTSWGWVTPTQAKWTKLDLADLHITPWNTDQIISEIIAAHNICLRIVYINLILFILLS